MFIKEQARRGRHVKKTGTKHLHEILLQTIPTRHKEKYLGKNKTTAK